MYELMVPILAFVSVISIGGAVLTGVAARRNRLRSRLGEMGGEAAVTHVAESRSGLRRGLESVAAMFSIGNPSARLREELAKAGFHGAMSPNLYLGIKTLLLITGIVVLALLLTPLQAPLSAKVVLIVGGAAFLSFVPNFIVRLRRVQRAEEIRRHLPDALDLLEICVSSGMGLDTAWNSVADEVRGVSTTLADEMALTNLELHLGSSRAAAMRKMAERTDVEEVSSLVAVLIQSERFGTSISDALRTYASSMRERRSQRAAEAAEKMAVKILIPMILFIFPAVFVVAVGPACIQIVGLFSSS